MPDILRAIELSAALMVSVVALAILIAATMIKRAETTALAATPRTVTARRDNAISRRSWLSWLAMAWTAFCASVLTGVAATGRVMFPNVLFEPPQTFKAGSPDTIQLGEVDERFKQSHGIWLVRDVDPVTGETGIAALSDICTHLGCIPNWLESEQKFKCPCHGSGYYKNGINFEGPTPRPLERFAISLGSDGQILVDKTRKFQYEKGQWSDPASFLKLS